jgi:hypothetical protein
VTDTGAQPYHDRQGREVFTVHPEIRRAGGAVYRTLPRPARSRPDATSASTAEPPPAPGSGRAAGDDDA